MTDQTTPPNGPDNESRFDRSRLQREINLEIRRLHRLCNRGLWGLALFVLISICAQQARYLPPLSTEVRNMLGAAPPVKLISIALVVYSFSALILILSRMMGGTDSYRGWSHLGYLSGFYLFYYYAEVLPENFWAVFAAGITILSLEYYSIWTYCSDAIRTERELLRKLEE